MRSTGAEVGLIGRAEEYAALAHALAAVPAGVGGILLLTGEAGVGKSRLLETCLARSGLVTLHGYSAEVATPPYGPIAAALRAYLRLQPNGLSGRGLLDSYLALVLPELGSPPPQSDQAVLVEAICQACIAIARTNPAVLVFDDLQWADNATLELLTSLAGALVHERLLIVGAYRSDEIRRGHPLRHVRNELRRRGLLRELALASLDQPDTTALAAQLFGQPPGPELAANLYAYTEGLPLFVTELAGALALRGLVRQDEHGVELPPGATLPIPDTLRDAVLLRLDGLPEAALRILHLAAVAGRTFDLDQVLELAGTADGVDLLLERGLLVEPEPGRAAFRHALTREAIYNDISWVRRRALHRQLADRLQLGGAAPLTVAQHWLAAREPDHARAALLAAAEHACAIHAYRDAVAAAQRALELWPEGQDEPRRLAVLDRLGHCAQLCGLLSEAAQAWREVADGRRQCGELHASAVAERNLANVAELQTRWEVALAAREAAASAFAASGLPAEAAAERLSAAAHLRSAGRSSAALALLAIAAAEAAQAGRVDLQARILGHEGNALARLGRIAEGLALVRRGLALALEHNLPHAAAEIYQRLADALEHGGDYAGARETYLTAFDFCQTNAVPATAQLCVACLTVVLRQTGEWDRAITLCREALASPHSSAHARTVAGGILGSLYAMRGQARLAQPLLLEAAALARQIELASMELLIAWGLALLAELDGDPAAVAEHCRSILSRWEGIEELHYVIAPLRWAVNFFATSGADAAARSAANALARIASATGQPEALSALAFALGEIALLDGDPRQAVQQFQQSLDLLRDLPIPYCQAGAQLRAGNACAAVGQRDVAVAHLVSAYRTARRLGARPMASAIAGALTELGEPIVERLGQGAATRLHSGNLTRRQREILTLMAEGQTNAEIARAFVLSPRTVETHVANILATLDSRSRTEAVRRAMELGLLFSTPPEKTP